MNDDPGSTSGPAHRNWWDRLGHIFSGEPRSRPELLAELRAAQTNGLLSVDTLTMVEGAIKVTELSVDDVMIPRTQIVMLPVNWTGDGVEPWSNPATRAFPCTAKTRTKSSASCWPRTC